MPSGKLLRTIFWCGKFDARPKSRWAASPASISELGRTTTCRSSNSIIPGNTYFLPPSLIHLVLHKKKPQATVVSFLLCPPVKVRRRRQRHVPAGWVDRVDWAARTRRLPWQEIPIVVGAIRRRDNFTNFSPDGTYQIMLSRHSSRTVPRSPPSGGRVAGSRDGCPRPSAILEAQPRVERRSGGAGGDNAAHPPSIW